MQGLIKDNQELSDLASRQMKQIQSLEAAVHSLQKEAEKYKFENSSLMSKAKDLSSERDALKKEYQKLVKLNAEEKSASDKQLLGIERNHDKSLHELQRKIDGVELENDRLKEKIKMIEEDKRDLMEKLKEKSMGDSLKKQTDAKEQHSRFNKQLSDFGYQLQRHKEESDNRSLWEFDDVSSSDFQTKNRANIELFEIKNKYINELRDVEKKYATKLEAQLQAAISHLKHEYETTIESLTKQQNESIADSKEKSKNISELKQRYSSLEETNETLTTDYGKIKLEVEFYKSKNNQLKDEIDQAEEKFIVAHREIAVLKSDLLSQLNLIKLKEESHQRLKEDFAKLQSIASETRKREVDEENIVRAKSQEIEDLKNQLSAAQTTTTDLSNQKLKIEQELKNLTNQIHEQKLSFSKDRERLEEALNQKEQQLRYTVPEKEVETKIQHLVNDHKAEISNIESKYRRTINELERSLSEKFSSNLNQTNSRHDQITQKVLKHLMQLETQIARLKSELNKVKSDSLGELKANKYWAQSACDILIEELQQSRQFRDSHFEAYYSKLEAEFKDTASKLFKSERALPEKEEELAEAREGNAE